MKTLIQRVSIAALSAILLSAVLYVAAGHSQTQQASNTNPFGRIIYPAEGQSPEQQKQDEGECYNWAVQQTNWDPIAGAQQAGQQIDQAGQQAQATQGQAVRGAARGAVAGVAIGAIAGDAGKGAAIGATAGGLAGGMRRRDQVAKADAQAKQVEQQYQAAAQQWDRGYVACLEGRGYTVS